MTRQRIIIFLSMILILNSAFCFAADRFPRPEFTSDYQKPQIISPLPEASWIDYLDMAVLVMALTLASWLALRKRSRNGLFVLSLFSLAYFGFWRSGCICPIGAIQNVTLALFEPGYTLPMVVLVFFFLPLLFALFFGRTFCAAVCPLGAIQDLMLLRPHRIPAPVAAVLGLLPVIFLGAAVLFSALNSGFIICRLDPFVSFFRFSGEFKMIILGVLFLLVALFFGRPYCRFMCPYGVLLSWVSRFSKWHVSITPDHCTQCRLCENSCPFEAINTPLPEISQTERQAAFKRFRLQIPLLIILFFSAGGILGYGLHIPLSKMNSTVSLAEQVVAEQLIQKETTLASRTFHESGKTLPQLLQEAKDIRNRFRVGSTILGFFIGLMFCIKILAVTTRRPLRDYEADRGACFSCGRCFAYCPDEHERQKLLTDQPDKIYESIG